MDCCLNICRYRARGREVAAACLPGAALRRILQGETTAASFAKLLVCGYFDVPCTFDTSEFLRWVNQNSQRGMNLVYVKIN